MATSLDGDIDGFSLLEVLLACGILAAALVALTPLFTLAVRSNLSSRTTTFAVTLAAQKLEELRALTWAFDAAGASTTDSATNTAVYPESSAGGTGLQPSSPSTLDATTSGYVDFIDEAGRKVRDDSAGPRPAYVRRWAIDPLPSNPELAIVIAVSVLPAHRAGEPRPPGRRWPGEVRMVTVRTRTAP